MNAAVRRRVKYLQTTRVGRDDAHERSSSIEKIQSKENEETTISALNEIKSAVNRIKTRILTSQDEDGAFIALEDSLAAIRAVCMAAEVEETRRVGIMLGRRTFGV